MAGPATPAAVPASSVLRDNLIGISSLMRKWWLTTVFEIEGCPWL
jgi:hypothetical protein